MTTKPRIKLTWFTPDSGSGRWMKTIGGKRFYFGADREAAELEALAIEAVWKHLRAQGVAKWPPGQPDRQSIQQTIGILPPANALVAKAAGRIVGASGGSGGASGTGSQQQAPTPAPTAPPTVSVLGLTVEQTINLYLDSRKNDVTAESLASIRGRLARVGGILGMAKTIHSIDQTALTRLTAHLKDPANKIGPAYAVILATYAKAMLSWAADHDSIQWQKPNRFDSLLTIDVSRPRNPEELEALKEKLLNSEGRFFTIEQLRKLYRGADDNMKAWILLGLNCCFYPTDIAGLKKTDFRRNGKGIKTLDRIETVRGKTLVVCKWDLWPETTAAIKKVLTPAGTSNVFNAKKGKPVTRYVVGDNYKQLRAAVCPDAPDFKFLRHTSANAIKKISTGEISELHLAHIEGLKMQGPYTERLWEQHSEALAKLRKVFKRVWS